MKSSEQLQRMIQLVPYLRANPGISVTEAAEAFNTTPAVILRDLAVIQFCGLPGGLTDDLFDVDIEAAREGGEIYLSNADVLARPMTLTAAQASSLMVALGALEELGHEAAASARDKLTAACGQAHAGIELTMTSGDATVRRRLAKACEQRKVVRIHHEAADGTAEVDVEPARLRVVDGATYLDAWSRRRQSWRSFRLDRITQVDVLAEVAPVRAGLESATRTWFADAQAHVELRVGPGGTWVSEYYPTSSTAVDGDGIRITLPLGSRDWAVALLLRLGHDLVDVSDHGLAQEAAQRARQALTAYRV